MKKTTVTPTSQTIEDIATSYRKPTLSATPSAGTAQLFVNNAVVLIPTPSSDPKGTLHSLRHLLSSEAVILTDSSPT
jgi:hypothetical protein